MSNLTQGLAAYPMMFKPLQTTEAISALGVGSERHVRNLCEDGTLKAVKSGRSWRVNTRAALDYFGLEPEDCIGILA